MSEVLVTIATYRDLPEALLVQGKLESEGIEAILADDNVVRMDWFWANAMGGVKLKVASEDVERAIEVLNEAIPETLTDESGEDYVQPACPKCGSLDVTFDAPLHGMQLAALGMAALPIPAGKQRWMCAACGAEWEVLPDEETL
jgi:hypothetical protein